MNFAPDIQQSPTHPAWPFWVVVLYLVLVCLPVRFEIGSLQLTGLRLYLGLIFLPALVATLRRRPPGRDLLDAALALHLLWSAIAITQTSPAQLLENTGANTLELTGGYLIARLCIADPDRFRQTVWVIATLATLTVPFAVLESLTNRPILIMAIEALPNFGSVSQIDIAPRLGLFRVQAVFAHPIHYGLFMASVLALSWLALGGHVVARSVFAAASVLGAFFALSSGALLYLIIQIILLVWVTTLGARPKVWLAFAILIALVWVGIDLLSNRSPLRVFMSYATFSAHNAFWRGLIFEWGMFNIAQNPIFGLGFNDWVRPAFMLSGSLDNFWLTVAMRYGLPGFVALAVAVLYGITRAAFARITNDGNLRIGWVIAMVGLVIALGTVHVWTAIYSYVFFLLGAGQWLAQSDRQPNRREIAPTAGPMLFSRELSIAFNREGSVT